MRRGAQAKRELHSFATRQAPRLASVTALHQYASALARLATDPDLQTVEAATDHGRGLLEVQCRATLKFFMAQESRGSFSVPWMPRPLALTHLHATGPDEQSD